MPRKKEKFNPLNPDFMSRFEPIIMSGRPASGIKIVTKNGTINLGAGAQIRFAPDGDYQTVFIEGVTVGGTRPGTSYRIRVNLNAVEAYNFSGNVVQFRSKFYFEFTKFRDVQVTLVY